MTQSPTDNYYLDIEICVEFAEESIQQLDEACCEMRVLQVAPNQLERLEKICDLLYSIRTSSAYLDLLQISSLASAIKDLLELAGNGKVRIDADLDTVFSRAVEMLRSMLGNVERAGQETDDFDSYVRLLDDISTRIVRARNLNQPSLWQELEKEITAFGINLADNEQLRPLWNSLASKLKDLCPMIGDIGNCGGDGKALAGSESGEAPRSDAAGSLASRILMDLGRRKRKTMRIYEDSIDSFLDLIGELVIVAEMYGHIQKRFEAQMRGSKDVVNFKKNNENFNDLSAKLQKSVLDIRRVPVRTLLQRAQRIVHDAVASKDKEIEVSVFGQDTMVDKSLLEILEAPFIHIIRNAADHGIEDKPSRSRNGKPVKGSIMVTAWDDDVNVFISIEDDGAGLDREVIVGKAVEGGLVDAKEAAAMSDEDVFGFLFVSGFSTAERITDVSGRGVGLDAAISSIEKIKGRITIRSERSKGTVFTIIVPKTVAVNIIEGFLFSLCDGRFVIQMKHVVESFELDKERINTLPDGTHSILHHGRTYPIVFLEDILCCPSAGRKRPRCVGLRIVDDRGNECVCIVDDVLGTQQVVVKDIKGIAGKPDIIAGGAILGDERVAIVLKAEKILASCAAKDQTVKK